MAKGFTQIEGVNFQSTFVSVTKLVTVRTILAVTFHWKWSIHQLDFNNASLHGDLEEDDYLEIPQGFVKTGDKFVYKLQKSLYGLWQASRNWYKSSLDTLLSIGFQHSKADYLFFIFQIQTAMWLPLSMSIMSFFLCQLFDIYTNS